MPEHKLSVNLSYNKSSPEHKSSVNLSYNKSLLEQQQFSQLVSSNLLHSKVKYRKEIGLKALEKGLGG